MRYTTKRTPAQRKLEGKMLTAFAASSSESEDEGPAKKKRTDKQIAREAQEAHVTMCAAKQWKLSTAC
jgi:hypothetical protein